MKITKTDEKSKIQCFINNKTEIVKEIPHTWNKKRSYFESH